MCFSWLWGKPESCSGAVSRLGGMRDPGTGAAHAARTQLEAHRGRSSALRLARALQMRRSPGLHIGAPVADQLRANAHVGRAIATTIPLGDCARRRAEQLSKLLAV